jgi:hypothetical protein
MAELMLGQPLFPGESGIDQLVEIIKVLGTPSREQIKTMNPNYMEHKFPQIKPHPFAKVFRPRTAPEAIELVGRLLEYTPEARLSAVEAMVHPFFDELRVEGARMPNGKDFPVLFDFAREGPCPAFFRVEVLRLTRPARALRPPGPQPPAGADVDGARARSARDPARRVRADTARADAHHARLSRARETIRTRVGPRCKHRCTLRYMQSFRNVHMCAWNRLSVGVLSR